MSDSVIVAPAAEETAAVVPVVPAAVPVVAKPEPEEEFVGVLRDTRGIRNPLRKGVAELSLVTLSVAQCLGYDEKQPKTRYIHVMVKHAMELVTRDQKVVVANQKQPLVNDLLEQHLGYLHDGTSFEMVESARARWLLERAHAALFTLLWPMQARVEAAVQLLQSQGRVVFTVALAEALKAAPSIIEAKSMSIEDLIATVYTAAVPTEYASEFHYTVAALTGPLGDESGRITKQTLLNVELPENVAEIRRLFYGMCAALVNDHGLKLDIAADWITDPAKLITVQQPAAQPQSQNRSGYQGRNPRYQGNKPHPQQRRPRPSQQAQAPQANRDVESHAAAQAEQAAMTNMDVQ